MNTIKTAFWMTLLTVILVLLGRLFFGTGGMVVFLLLAVLMNGFAYFFSDKVAIAAAQAVEVSPAEAPMLHRLADRLAQQYNVPKPRVYLSPDPSPNAFATGRNPEHAAICVNAGLLRLLDRRQVFAVLAHEFAHVGNRDILISSVAAVLAGAITFVANIASFGLWFGGGDDDEGNPLGFIGVLAAIILAPLAA